MAAKDMEIAGLRAHINDALALVPSSMYTDQSLGRLWFSQFKVAKDT